MISVDIVFSDLGLDTIGWPLPRLVHEYLALRVHVDAKTYLVLIEVVHGVEVTEERITYQVQVLVLARQSALMNYKIALAFVALVQVLLWRDLEYVVTHLETDWLDFLRDILAR